MACNIVLKMYWEDQGDVLKGRASSGRATEGCISQESQGVIAAVGICGIALKTPKKETSTPGGNATYNDY